MGDMRAFPPSILYIKKSEERDKYCDITVNNNTKCLLFLVTTKKRSGNIKYQHPPPPPQTLLKQLTRLTLSIGPQGLVDLLHGVNPFYNN